MVQFQKYLCIVIMPKNTGRFILDSMKYINIASERGVNHQLIYHKLKVYCRRNKINRKKAISIKMHKN